jgi:hypothetical protein
VAVRQGRHEEVSQWLKGVGYSQAKFGMYLGHGEREEVKERENSTF